MQSSNLGKRLDLVNFRILLASPLSHIDFISELKRYGTSKICSSVWPTDSIAYRCNTCALNANMALCFECFDLDKHEGHDFYKFKTTTAEGKCDCGDGGILKPEGFCDKATGEMKQPPEDLLEAPKLLLPQLVVETFQIILKNNERTDIDGVEYLMLAMLEDYADASVHLRDIIVSALVDRALFRNNFDIKLNNIELEMEENSKGVYKHGEDTFRNLVERSDKDNVNLKENMLDAIFLMATVRNCNPTFFKLFMKLSADFTFKKHLAKVVSRNYIPIMCFFQKIQTSELDIKSSDRFAALSSQIFTWSSQSIYLTNELKLPIYVLLLTHYCLSLYVSSSTGKYNFENYPRGFNKNIYLPVSQDLQLLFGNRHFILEFAENHMIFKVWLDILVEFQGIESNKRILSSLQTGGVLIPFWGMNADFEICISPALAFVQTFKESRRAIHSTRIFRYLLEYSVNALNENEHQAMNISFHMPLFRVLFMFIACDIHTGAFTHDNFEFEQGFIKFLLPNVFRLWSAAYEMVVNWWPYNGVYIHEVSKMYKVPHFSAGTVDPDIYMTQLAASQVNPNFFVQMILSSFHTLYDLEGRTKNYFTDHQPASFIDQVLLYFAILIAGRALAGENDDGSLRSEIICVLATKKRTKSGLLEMLPDRGINLQYKWLEDLDQILDDVAILENKHFGTSNEPLARTFSLKARTFIEEYDPVLTHMRSVNMGGMEESLARYYKSVEKEKLNRGKVALWPPYRRPLKEHHPFLDGFTNFLHCISFHGLLFKILHRCMNDKLGDNTLQTAVHLINMSFSYPYISRKLPVESQFLICENCFIPFDLEYNVLDNYGLLHVFDDINQRTELPDYTEDRKERQIGYLYSSNLVDYHASAAYVPNLPPLTTENRSDETILSLLLKLFEKHTKKYYKPVHMRGQDAIRYGSYNSSGVRIGGAEFFIGEVLDSLVENSEKIVKVVEEYVASKSQAEEQEPEGEDRKARLKRLAQEKKERALKKMQKKSKAFHQTNEEDETETIEEPEDIPLCCLCSKTLFQDDDMPTTVVFVTRTNLMGHRVCKPQPFMSRLNINTFAYNFQFIQALNEIHFPKSRQVSEWYDNLWVQTCGHHIHFSCYNKYIAEKMSLQQQLLQEHERYGIFTSEFWCPYCRQLCNGVLPLVSTPLYARPLRKPRVIDYEFILSIISEPNQEEFVSEIYHIVSYFSDITQADQIQFPFFASLLRNNIELMLMNKGLLAQEIQQNEFFSLKKLFKTVPTISIYNICQHAVQNEDREKVIGMMQVLDPYGDDNRRCNIALADLKQLLVTTLIFLPRPSPELMKGVIYFFMNLHLVQLISWMVVAADEDEIKDWIVEKNLSDTQLEFITKMALNQFQDKRKRKQKEGENRYVYFQTINDRLTEFVKFCVVLYYSVFNFSDALKEDLECYDLWQFYDVLIEGELSSDDGISFIKCFGWDESTIALYSQKICREIDFVTGISKDFYMVREMMMVNWEPPKLVSLPDTFDEFLDIFEQKRLRSFNQVENSSDQSYFICLVCSKYFTIPGKNKYPMKKSKHMERCGRGTCIVMDPYRNLVMILWDKRTSFWDSIYMDKHGETNINLTKITKMYLCPQRVHMLQSMWLFNSFDVFSKNWDLRFH